MVAEPPFDARPRASLNSNFPASRGRTSEHQSGGPARRSLTDDALAPAPKPSMRTRTHAPLSRFFGTLAALLLLSNLLAPLAAQPVAPTREERLLNGLQIYFFQRPGAQKVWMRLRVNNSGAAFDLAGKEGMARLLADALFEDASTGQYVAEELGGRLDVRVDYSTIEVTISGDASRFDDLVEVLRNALLQMRLTPDEVRRLKEARLKLLGERAETAGTKADRAAAARLFGSYPLGRPAEGAAESIARVERADLMLARDRFLNPNNSVLVVAGPVEPARAMRTFRQFLGPWRKSDETVPATFRQPAPPDARALVVDVPGAAEAEVRLAARGLALSDKDQHAAGVLASAVRLRLLAALKDVAPGKLSAHHTPHALSGIFILGATVPAARAAEAVEAARTSMRSLVTSPVTAAELEMARREIAGWAADDPQYAFAADWLNAHTYGPAAGTSTSALDSTNPLNSLTTADLQRVAARLFRDAPIAAVVAGDAAALRASLANLPGGVEEPAASKGQPAPTPAARPQLTPVPLRRP